MRPPRKPKPDRLPTLLNQAIRDLNQASDALATAKGTAAAEQNEHAKHVLSRLLTHTIAISKGANQLLHHGAPPQPPTEATEPTNVA